MKLQILKSILLLTICSLSLGTYAQERKAKKGTKKFEKYAFIDARKLYKHVSERGFNTPEVLTKLGDSYYFTEEYQQAVKWYEKLFNENKTTNSIDPEYYFRYAQSLKSTKTVSYTHLTLPTILLV